MTTISKRTVDDLTPTAARAIYLWDDRLPGFGVKCLPSGKKRYVLKYRANGGGRKAPQRWLSLGTHGVVTPDQARRMAQQALAAVTSGDDPQGSKLRKREAPTLEDVWQRFSVELLPLRKPRTRADYKSQWSRTLAPTLGAKSVELITRSDVERMHKSLGATPYQANRLLALLSRLMNMSEAWDLRPVGSNPCRFVERFKEVPRNRYLSRNELASLGATMQLMVDRQELSRDAANAIRLLLLTGARLNEILSAEWQWLDIERSLLQLPDSKTGAKAVFLSEVALAVLADQRAHAGSNDKMFPGPGAKGQMVNLRKPWQRVCKKAGLENVRLHDLRHTAASVAVAEGASLPVIGRLLGHSQAQTTQRYAHVDNDPALRAANAIGSAMLSIMPKSKCK